MSSGEGSVCGVQKMMPTTSTGSSFDCGLLMTTCDFDACGDSFLIDDEDLLAGSDNGGDGSDEDEFDKDPNADLLAGEMVMFQSGAKAVDVNKHYTLHAEIGAGHFGRVYECVRRIDGRLFACKQLDKKQIRDQQNVCREVSIMRRLEHINILQIIEVYETEKDAWIVSELCEGGDLLHHLMRRGGALSETAARVIMQQLFSAVDACHKVGVVHRDLKPENVMLVRKATGDDDVEIKVIDFGLSCIYDGEHELHRVVGTPYYMAPEVLSENHSGYTSACDLWSLGVIFYLILCGRPPFASEDQPFIEGVVRKRKRASVEELKRRIVAGDFALDFGSWLRCSTEACELVCGLLRVDAKLRLSAAEALRHDFIRVEECARTDPEPLGATALEALARFARTTFFHKRLYTTLAETLTTRELRVLRAEFEALDDDDDGYVSCADLVSALRRREHATSQIEVESIFDACELGADHLVSYDEFVLASVHRCRYLREDRVDALFKEYLDATSNEQYVTAESLRKHGFDADSIADVFKAAQVKVNGRIDRDEFDNLLRLGHMTVHANLPKKNMANGQYEQPPRQQHPKKKDNRHTSFKLPETTSNASGVRYSDDMEDVDEDLEVDRILGAGGEDIDDNSATDDVYAIQRHSDFRDRLHRLGVSEKGVTVMTPKTAYSPRADGPFWSDSEKHLNTMTKVVDQAEEIEANSVETLEEKAAASLRYLKELEPELDPLFRDGSEAERQVAESRYLALAETAMRDCRAAAIAFRKEDRLDEAIAAFREAKNLEFVLAQRGVLVEDKGEESKEATARFAMPPPTDTEVQRRAERIIPRKRRSLAARFLPNPRRFLTLKRKQ